MSASKPVRVMVVEDSPTVRTLLCHIIDRDPRLQLASVCGSAEEALASIGDAAPDVISMDIRLPGLSGLDATRRIMAEAPTPIVVIADSIHDTTLGIAMNALKAGALSVVEKPVGPAVPAYQRMAQEIATQLYLMSQVPVIRRRRIDTSLTPTVFGQAKSFQSMTVVGIAASTGGPLALSMILGALPASFPAPILVVQHMGGAFMEGFASWLDTQTPLHVAIASNGEKVEPGRVYVAPGDRHMALASEGFILVTADAPVNNQRPAANVLFESMAVYAGAKSVGVLLTGMGEDGARGLLSMRRAGALTIAEHESTAVVYGMPGAAAKLGAATQILTLDTVAPRLLKLSEGATA
jgi:two-component system, chemotaxis family, protein-glutamate methylesterase/glutaminase